VRWRQDELLPVQEAFLASVQKQGIEWVDDLNAPAASGIGAIPMNRRDGVRMSTALTYLPLARRRDNLTIWPGTEVTRVVLGRGRATGVDCVRDGSPQRVAGSRVVVCGGALQSPALLMRSGIGPSRHLAEVGIECLVDLAGVGENLMDHEGTAVFLLPGWSRRTTGCASSAHGFPRRRGRRPTTCGSACGARGTWVISPISAVRSASRP
jgi:choline dehydrogenase